MDVLSPIELANALPKHDYFSAIHFNACSLKKNFDHIHTLLHRLKHHFSVLCFSETWLSSDDRNLYSFRDYHCEFANRTRDAHGGSAIFISKQLPYTRRTDIEISVAKCESVWIELEPVSTINNKKSVFASIYRSPSSDAADFCNALAVVLDKLTFENKNVFVMGDININLLDSSNRVCIDYISCFSSFGLHSLINVPTRRVNDSISLLDHILSNFDEHIYSGALDCDISDHLAVFFYLTKSVVPVHLPQLRTSFDRNEFVRIISITEWSHFLNFTDPEAALSEFYSVITDVIQRCTKTSSSKRRYRAPRAPWITQSLLSSLRKKDNLYKKTKRQPNIQLQIKIAL